MTRLMKSIEQLAAAAMEFEEACNETYQKAKIFSDGPGQKTSPEVRVYNRIERELSGSVYSKVQWRAIQGAVGAWRAPQCHPVKSLPLTGRSGGAA